MATEPELLAVEVAYAEPERQVLIRLEVPPGTTLREAVIQSGIGERFGGLDLSEGNAGIFGRIRPLNTVLKAGDRVEVYRPLTRDPKEVRRRRAKLSSRDPE